MATVNVLDVLQKVFGAKGLPFPIPPKKGVGSGIGGKFGEPLVGTGKAGVDGYAYNGNGKQDEKSGGAYIRKYEDESLGQYTFLPVQIDSYYLPNPLIIISGEKEIIETNIIDAGTVFEKVYTRPYDISIICTLIGEQGHWPEAQLKQIISKWKKDDIVTLNCAITNMFLAEANNFLITKISVLDNQGAENVEVIQIDGRSNIEFELEIK